MAIALLATCTAGAFRPGLTNAILRHGHALGLDLIAPSAQTCCGLPAWDAGQNGPALAAARHTLRVFAGFDAIVTPSPACLRMLRHHLPLLLAGQPEAADARALAAHSFTWLDYLANHVDPSQIDLSFPGKIAYFPPCTQTDDASARQLLGRIRNATLLPDPICQCCGYGANLAWRHPELGQAMASPVITALRLSRADLILTSDVGCLIHLQPLLRRPGDPRLLHLAEFLAPPAA